MTTDSIALEGALSSTATYEELMTNILITTGTVTLIIATGIIMMILVAALAYAGEKSLDRLAQNHIKNL